MIDVMDNLLNIISKEDPRKLLKSTFEEISSRLKYKLRKENLVFIYEAKREILRSLASTVSNISQIRIHLSNEDELKKQLISGQKVFLKITSKNIDTSDAEIEEVSLYLYPIVLNDKLIGAVGFFEDPTDEQLLKEELYYFSILIDLVLETLKIQELKEKISLMVQLTNVLEEITEENVLINNVLHLIKNSLHAECLAYWKFEDNKLVLNCFTGLEDSKVRFKTLDVENSLEGRTIKEKSSFFLIGRENFENYPLAFDIDLKSSIHAIVEQNNEIYGVLSAYNREEGFDYRTYKNFDETDFSVLNDSAKRLAFSFHRIKLYRKLQDEVSKLTSLKESHEKLIEMQKEYLDRMNSLDKISQAVRSVYDKNLAIKIMLLGLTSGRGLKFNRALYLEKDSVRGLLIPKLWVGPDEDQDANEVWKEANIRAIKYGSLTQYLKEEGIRLPSNNKLTLTVQNKVLAYKGHPILERVVEKKQVIHVVPQMLEIKWEDLEDIYDIVRTEEFLIFPITGMLETKGVIIVDNKITRKPVTTMDIEIVKLFKDNVGLAIEMIENYQELSQKTKRLEEQKDLMDYYRRFKDNILQNLPVAIIVVDRGGKITEWNKKAENIFSRPRENVMGTSIADLVSVFGDDIIEIIQKVYHSRNYLKLQNYKLYLSNEERTFDIQFSPLRNEELGVVEGIIIVFDDVTELYNLQKEMEKREKLATMGEMAAKIAHEIRNPLTVIGGFLNRLNKKAGDNEYVQKYTKIIGEELYRLENIVNEILEYTRGVKLMQVEEIDLIEIIREVLLMYEDFIKQKDIMLNIEWLNERVFVKADRDKIKQVLINLIKNSIEVVDENGKIDIKVGKEDGKAFFEISNNGAPISAEVKDKLFTPFFTTKSDGTGLGLAICKKIIEEEHKGKIFLVKSDETGTSFRFEIPLVHSN